MTKVLGPYGNGPNSLLLFDVCGRVYPRTTCIEGYIEEQLNY